MRRLQTSTSMRAVSCSFFVAVLPGLRQRPELARRRRHFARGRIGVALGAVLRVGADGGQARLAGCGPDQRVGCRLRYDFEVALGGERALQLLPEKLVRARPRGWCRRSLRWRSSGRPRAGHGPVGEPVGAAGRQDGKRSEQREERGFRRHGDQVRRLPKGLAACCRNCAGPVGLPQLESRPHPDCQNPRAASLFKRRVGCRARILPEATARRPSCLARMLIDPPNARSSPR